MRPRQNGMRGMRRNESSQTCGGDLTRPEFGERLFLNVGGPYGWSYLLPRPPQAPYVKSITLKGTRYWPRRAGALLDSTPAYFSETKKQDFTRYFQSLDTNSCELISSTAPGAHFRSAHHPLLRSRVCSHFWSPLLYHYRPRTLSNGKSAKVLFMANCGMRVAMEISEL
jgi:hypothetical protein